MTASPKSARSLRVQIAINVLLGVEKIGIQSALTPTPDPSPSLYAPQGEGRSPVGTPQAAIETPGIEHAGQRIPDVLMRIGLPRQRAGAADLDYRVRPLGQCQHFRQFGPGLGRGRGHARLQKAEMVDDGAIFGSFYPNGPISSCRSCENAGWSILNVRLSGLFFVWHNRGRAAPGANRHARPIARSPEGFICSAPLA
jgi:hypothetical protein